MSRKNNTGKTTNKTKKIMLLFYANLFLKIRFLYLSAPEIYALITDIEYLPAQYFGDCLFLWNQYFIFPPRRRL
jgi:hypothetical protein